MYYRITKTGKKFAQVPSASREPIIDHLYEFKVASKDELLALSKDGRVTLREYLAKDYVEEVQ